MDVMIVTPEEMERHRQEAILRFAAIQPRPEPIPEVSTPAGAGIATTPPPVDTAEFQRLARAAIACPHRGRQPSCCTVECKRDSVIVQWETCLSCIRSQAGPT